MKEVAELHIAPISVSILFFLFAFFQFQKKKGDGVPVPRGDSSLPDFGRAAPKAAPAASGDFDALASKVQARYE